MTPTQPDNAALANNITKTLLEFFLQGSPAAQAFFNANPGEVGALVGAVTSTISPKPSLTGTAAYRQLDNYLRYTCLDPTVNTGCQQSPDDFRAGVIRAASSQCAWLGGSDANCADDGVAKANAIADEYAIAWKKVHP